MTGADDRKARACPRCQAPLATTAKGLVHCTGPTCTWGLDLEYPIYEPMEYR